ncbi:unnamed protein product [Meganyctiphanes norvegica]|uniref:protein-histidine N-methyltransferase n=1 Tax=Meganyctiphanes norvegica TaxID=48144 RepID=A0AAV2PV78_MEGNR
MFEFKFNIEEDEDSSINKSNEKTDASAQLQWLPAKHHPLSLKHLKVLADGAIIEEVTVGKTKIKYISLSSVENIALKDSLSTNISPAFKSHTDLVPAIYEGGLKIWECTWDLLKHLDSSNIDFTNCKILELGCGAALPAIYTATYGAQITIQDYNEEVIDLVTAPNVILNLTNHDVGTIEGDNISKESSLEVNVPESILKEMATKASLYSGDWGSFNTMISATSDKNKNSEEKFDLILSCETIYNPDCHQKLLNALTNNLKQTGTILLAAKNHYFGVGGGTQQFIDLVHKEGKLNVETHITNSEGVKREILEMHHK